MDCGRLDIQEGGNDDGDHHVAGPPERPAVRVAPARERPTVERAIDQKASTTTSATINAATRVKDQCPGIVIQAQRQRSCIHWDSERLRAPIEEARQIPALRQTVEAGNWRRR